MQNILLAIHIIIAFLLIVSVLLQRSEGGGLGIGGNAGGNAKAAQGGLDGLQKLTWGLGIAFIISSLVLVIIAANDTGQSGSSLLNSLDGLDAGATLDGATEAPAADTTPPADPNAIPADPTQN